MPHLFSILSSGYLDCNRCYYCNWETNKKSPVYFYCILFGRIGWGKNLGLIFSHNQTSHLKEKEIIAMNNAKSICGNVHFSTEHNVCIYSKRYPNSHGDGSSDDWTGCSSPQHTISSFTENEHRRMSPNFIFFRSRFCMSHLQFSEFLQMPASPVWSWHTLPSENRDN